MDIGPKNQLQFPHRKSSFMIAYGIAAFIFRPVAMWSDSPLVEPNRALYTGKADNPAITYLMNQVA
jgi:hypothetical protein